MISYKEEITGLVHKINKLHCRFCGEERIDQLYLVLPLDGSDPYIACHWCSGLKKRHKNDGTENINSKLHK